MIEIYHAELMKIHGPSAGSHLLIQSIITLDSSIII